MRYFFSLYYNFMKLETIRIWFISYWDDRSGIFSTNPLSVIKFDHLQTWFLVSRSLHRRLVARAEFGSVSEFARKLHFGRRWESRQTIFDLGRHRLGGADDAADRVHFALCTRDMMWFSKRFYMRDAFVSLNLFQRSFISILSCPFRYFEATPTDVRANTHVEI